PSNERRAALLRRRARKSDFPASVCFAVRLPERFRGGCAFGSEAAETTPISPARAPRPSPRLRRQVKRRGAGRVIPAPWTQCVAGPLHGRPREGEMLQEAPVYPIFPPDWAERSEEHTS